MWLHVFCSGFLNIRQLSRSRSSDLAFGGRDSSIEVQSAVCPSRVLLIRRGFILLSFNRCYLRRWFLFSDLVACSMLPLVVVQPRLEGVLFLVFVCDRVEPGLFKLYSASCKGSPVRVIGVSTPICFRISFLFSFR